MKSFPAAALERISILKTQFSKYWKSLPSQCSMLPEQASLQPLESRLQIFNVSIFSGS